MSTFRHLPKKLTASALIALLVAFLGTANGLATIVMSAGSGNWNTGATWAGGSVPALTDTVIIASNHTVTLTAAVNQSGVVTVTNGGTLVCNAILGIANSLNPGMVIDGTVNVTVNNGINTASSPTVRVTTNGVVILSTTAATVGATSWDLQAGSTIKLTATGNQTLDNSFVGADIDTLILAGSGVKTLGENTTVSLLLSLQGTATFSLGGRNLTYSSNAVLEYKGSAVQTVGPEFPATMTAGVNINNLSGVTLGAVKTLNGNLTLTSGMFTLSSALTLGAGVTITRDTGSFSTAPAFGAAVNVIYAGTTAVTTGNEIPTATSVLKNLTINKSGGVTLNGNATVNGALTLTNGTFTVGGNTLSLNGPAIAGTTANLSTTSASSLSFGGSSTGATLPASVTALNNLTINNANGLVLNGSPSLNTLTLTSGDITTGTNALIISNTSNTAITGGSSNSYVNGTVQKTFALGSGQSFNFPIGDAANYTPIGLAALNVTVAGSLKAGTTAADHPQIAASGIDAAHSVNRTWTLTNSPDGIAVSAGTVTLNFVAGDVDSGAVTGNFVVRRYDGSWNLTTTGTLNSTSSSVSGLTAFGDFAVGDQLINAIAFGQQPTAAVAGAVISPAVTVTATDVLGARVSGAPVSLALNTGTGTLSGTTPQTANSNGVATFNNVSVNLVGSKTLKAGVSSPALSVSSDAFAVTPGPIAAYSLNAATATRGTAFVITVTALDANNNTVTTDNSTVVTLSSSSASVLFDGAGNGSFNNTSITLTNGVAAISAMDSYSETVTLTATDANSKTGNTSVTISPVAGDFQSRATGNWNVNTTWSTWNGSAWVNAVSAPMNTTTGQISVTNVNTVTVTASVTASNLIINVGGTVSISSGQTLTVGNGVANGVISGAGILAERGTDTLLSLNGNNTYSGGTVISGGTVAVTNVTASGAQQLGSGNITFTNAGTLRVTGSGAQTTAKAVTLNTGGGVIAMQGLNSVQVTSAITGGGGLTSGGSDLILNRASGNNNIGAINVTSGRLFVFNTNSISGSAIAVQSGAILDFQVSGGATLVNAMTFASGSSLANRVGILTVNTTNATFPAAGAMIFNQDDQASTSITVIGNYPALTGDLTLQLGGYSTNVGTVTLSGVISGSGGIIKTLDGTLVLNSTTTNTYSGGTTISAGTMNVKSTSSFGSGNVTVASGASITLESAGSIAPTANLLLNTSAVVTNSFTGTNNISGLSFNDGNTFQPVGTWGTAGVAHTNTTFFRGAGKLNVLGLATVNIVNSSANPSTYGQSVTFTASVSSVAGAPTGTVQFQTNGVNFGSAATLSGGSATSPSISTLAAGTYTVTAVYSGDSSFTASTGTLAGGQTVNKLVASLTGSRTYDGTTTVGAAILSVANKVGSDNVTMASGSGLLSSRNVGTQNIVAFGTLALSGTAAGNYTLIGASGSVTVTKASLTITAAANTKIYDGTTNAAATPTSSGLQTGDALTGLTEAYTNKNVGAGKTLAVTTYTLTDGNNGTNYNVLLVNNPSGVISAATTALNLASSANPSLPASNVTFTATFTAVSPGSGTPTGNVQFLADGAPLGSPAALNGGIGSISTASLSHGTHSIAAHYAGDGNFSGVTNTLSPNQVINTPPVAGNATIYRNPALSVKVRIATLLTNATDADGDSLNLSVSSTSASNATITVSGGWVLYTPPAGFTNADSFSYTVADGYGGSATGMVVVAIQVNNSQSQNFTVTVLGNGSSLIQFNGIPGRTYTMQDTENLQSPVWQTLSAATADVFGKFSCTDTPPVSSPPRFYRTTYP